MTVLDRCPRCGRGSAVESVGGEPPVQTTHAEGCWEWGPKHYSCAVREIERLRARVAELECDARLGARVRKAVKRAHAHFGSTHDRIIAAAVINHLAEEGGKR